MGEGRQSSACSSHQPGLCVGTRAGEAEGAGRGRAGGPLLPPCRLVAPRVLGGCWGCRRFLGGSAQVPLPRRSGRIGRFPAASWDAVNGKLFPIPSEAQTAGKAEQEGIKRPLLPLCPCWEREGGVLAVACGGFERPGREHLWLCVGVQAAPWGPCLCTLAQSHGGPLGM